MLDVVANEHPDELTAPALLSWSKGSRGKESRPVGLLTRVPDPAFVTVSDFSTVLATSDRGGRDQLFGNLRRVYDGAFSRDLGNTERPLTWRGRLTILTACTPAIDNYSSHADALGPRWLSCRIAAQDDQAKRATGRQALVAGSLVEHRHRVAALAARIVESAAQRVPEVLSDDVTEDLLDVAIVACFGRATVERNGYGRREFTSLPTVEEPPRLAGQLGLLARSLFGLDLGADASVAICRRCALDSMPPVRRLCLATLARGEATASEVSRESGCHRQVARMALEELEAIGVVGSDDPETTENGKPHPYRLTAPYDRLIRRVMIKDAQPRGLTRKVGSHSQFSQREGGSRIESHVSCQGSQPPTDDAWTDSWAAADD